MAEDHGWKKPVVLVVRGSDGPQPLTLPAGGEGPNPLFWELSIRDIGMAPSPLLISSSPSQKAFTMIVQGGDGPIPLMLPSGDGPTPLFWELSIRYAGNTASLGAERTATAQTPTSYPAAAIQPQPFYYQGVQGDLSCAFNPNGGSHFLFIRCQGVIGGGTPTNPAPATNFDGFVFTTFVEQAMISLPSASHPGHHYDGYVVLLRRDALMTAGLPVNTVPEYLFLSVTPRPDNANIYPILQWVPQSPHGPHYADFVSARRFPYIE